jgi:hypothetical protein
VASPPPGETTQIANPERDWDVNAISLPSGDQSGSVGLGKPLVAMTCDSPPEGEIFRSARLSETFAA